MENRIKEFREMLGLSQQAFAELAGLHQNQIVNYERGRTDPTFKIISKIAKAFKINPAWLVGWSENIKPNQRPTRICYVSDGPTRIPPYLNTAEDGRVVKWKQTKRPWIGRRG